MGEVWGRRGGEVAPEYGGEGERDPHDVEADEGGRRALPLARLLCTQPHLVGETPGRCGGDVGVVYGEMCGRCTGDRGEI